MSKLYFRYGAMGSSKSANALMVEYNYRELGRKALLVKPRLDTREQEACIASRIGLKSPCIYLEELVCMPDKELLAYDCIIVDEAQFADKSQVEFLVHLADDLDIPVICYGLRTDFRREPFEGSIWLMAWADVIEEVKTVCWCGKAATCSARFDSQGRMIQSGEQIVMGANDRYTALCRMHHRRGELGRRITEAD